MSTLGASPVPVADLESLIARAGRLRLHDLAAVAQIRHELNAIDARKGTASCT